MTVEEEIRRRILETGSITFAEFMGLALFWPSSGYYTGPEPIGSSGDFYTSPHAHPAFGALIAVQLHQMWQVMDRPGTFTVVEMGAGNGRLCRDLTGYAAGLPGDFARCLQYVCLDTLVAGGVERENTGGTEGPRVNRISTLLSFEPSGKDGIRGIPLRGIKGCVLSNELLDAFPVHQVTLHQGNLKEVYVTLSGEELEFVLEEPSTPRLEARLDGLGIVLGEGQRVEINLGIEEWANQVASVLDTGFVLTVDYGRLAPELYSMELRPRGTLTTFYRHTQTDAPLQRIGRQDVTAQVDFTTVMEAGRRAGLVTLGFATQGRFLSNLGLPHLRRRLAGLELPRREIAANNTGMLDLARPGGLGDFKVLVQGKNAATPALWGFQETQSEDAVALESTVPLLDVSHIDLIEGRYPGAAFEFDWDPMSGIDTPEGDSS
ncbi:MAG: SAM-dependent methyltransferase [Planctomyces sp.]|nr:SAM-dependent methyltransferase [Planctomyces sp.]